MTISSSSAIVIIVVVVAIGKGCITTGWTDKVSILTTSITSGLSFSVVVVEAILVVVVVAVLSVTVIVTIESEEEDEEEEEGKGEVEEDKDEKVDANDDNIPSPIFLEDFMASMKFSGVSSFTSPCPCVSSCLDASPGP